MEYKIKGIQFKFEQLEEQLLGSLIAGEISPDHIFYLTSAKKPFLLLRAGELITGDFVEKYRAKGLEKIFTLSVVDPEIVEKYLNFFKAFDHSQKHFEKYKIKDAILLEFCRDFLDYTKTISLMNFVYPAYKYFNKIPKEYILNMQECNYTLLSRALTISALSIPTSLANGMFDKEVLSDIYQCAFLLDYGLLETNPSYLMFQACERERVSPGSGVEFLSSHPQGANEVDDYKKHPEASFDFAMANSDLFENPEMIQGILYHHEKYDGSGFPRKLEYSSISSWETVLILCDYLVPFSEHVYSSSETKSPVESWFEELKGSENLKRLPVLKLLGKWIGIQEWAKIHKGKIELEEIAV